MGRPGGALLACIESGLMPSIPPNVRHAFYLAVVFFGGGTMALVTVAPTVKWVIFLSSLASVLGAIFTDAPGTQARLAAARSAGVISAAAAADKIEIKEGTGPS